MACCERRWESARNRGRRVVVWMLHATHVMLCTFARRVQRGVYGPESEVSFVLTVVRRYLPSIIVCTARTETRSGS